MQTRFSENIEILSFMSGIHSFNVHHKVVMQDQFQNNVSYIIGL